VLDKKTGDMTELIEPAGKVEVSEKNMIEATVKELIVNSKSLEGIALCGTLPPGITGSTYTMITQMKPNDCVVILDAYQNIECLQTGKVNILKINTEESRNLASIYDDDIDITIVAKTILQKFRLAVLAITDGPSCAYLFERQGNEINVSKYKLPPLERALQDVELSQTPPSLFSSSLPEATGEAFQVRIGSSVNLTALGQSQELFLNPLGAGDTCSAIFLLEYLDTKVTIFLKQECINFFSTWISCCFCFMFKD
jgi:fructose-1-phosphate kinase PfkB-like protein